MYSFVDLKLRQQGYQYLKRSGRGLMRRYLEKMDGIEPVLEHASVTVYAGDGEVKAKPYPSASKRRPSLGGHGSRYPERSGNT